MENVHKIQILLPILSDIDAINHNQIPNLIGVHWTLSWLSHIAHVVDLYCSLFKYIHSL